MPRLTEEEKKELRAERVAIMMESGVPEDDANTYCDTVPELYGSGGN